MKAEFLVTIEGDWLDGDRRVTAAQATKDLRQAVKEQFRFLATRTSVKRVKASKPADGVAQ
jgi:hypothetical protein